MPGTTIIEGTWEEIKKLDSSLTGRRFRLVAIPDPRSPDSADGDPTLGKLFEGRIGTMSFDPPDLSERAKEHVAEAIEAAEARSRAR